MIYIIVSQAARIAVIWVKNTTGKKVLKTIAIGSITFYLTKRYKYLKDRDGRRNLHAN